MLTPECARRTWAQWRMVNSLLLATVLRTVLVVISYGCKVPAGIFVPSMAVGATFGRMVGILVKALYRYVSLPLFRAPEGPRKGAKRGRELTIRTVEQGASYVEYVCGLRSGKTLHYAGDVCFSRGGGGIGVSF